jgi:7-carboxy-7-deazaguanine synthase
MRISEIFYSIQGEGVLAGVPSAFVRTTGCPLRCEWCDSPYTSWAPVGESMTIDAILARLAEYPARHVVVTGGEPLIAPEVEPLCARLRELRYHITVETAATVFKPLECDLASLSPKLANSTPHHREGGRFALRHEEMRIRLDVIACFMKHCPYQLKFVVDQPGDVEEIVRLLDRLPPVEPERVLLMPQGVGRDELSRRGGWVAELCKQYGFRFCPRLHIDLYGNQRGT